MSATEPRTAERTVQALVMLQCGALPYVRLWRQSVGRALTLDGKRHITFGIVGMADLSGLFACGQRLEIETKSKGGRVRKGQREWRAMIEKMGGVYVLARSPDDAVRAVEEHRRACEVCSTRRAWKESSGDKHKRGGDGKQGRG